MKGRFGWSVGWVFGLALTLFALPAAAGWNQIFPGVEYSQWRNNTPQRISAVRVDLCHPGVTLRATKSSERRQTPSSFGQSVGAEVAINADFFNYSDYSTRGLAIGDGQRWPGSTDPRGREFIAFGKDRTLLSKGGQRVTNYGWMDDAVGGWFVVLNNNQVKAHANSEHCTTRHPRTVVGLSKNKRKLYMAVIDGRSTSSVGMRCGELGHLMKNLGAWNALSLDGGGSSAMWVRRKGVVSHPSDGSQRVVANHLAVLADNTGVPESCNDLEGAFAVKHAGARDFYQQGSSRGIPDVLVGDEFKANLILRNTSSTVYRGVKLDYWFRDTYLEPIDYTIYSDHPEFDRQTWKVNSADGDSQNPPKDMMGNQGTLVMHAFSPREAKRVEVVMRADRYSIGHTPHPDVRGWVRHINFLYGEQTGWNTQPTNRNRLGERLQDRVEVDVLSPHEWQFNGGEGQLEGWKACDGPGEGLSTGAEHTALVAQVNQGARCAVSPQWTSVDTEKYDQMVIRIEATSVPGNLDVRWKQDGEAFSRQRQASFLVEAGQPQTYVVDLSETGAWAGRVRGLELSWGDGAFDEIAVDAIFFQSSATQKTSSATEEFVDQSPVDLVDDSGSGDAGPDQPDADAGSIVTDAAAGDDIGSDTSSEETFEPVTTSTGCGCNAGHSDPLRGLAGLLLVGLWWMAGRRFLRRRR